MKNVMLLVVAVGLLLAVQSTGGSLISERSLGKTSIPQEDKTKIKKEELPEAARKTLDTDPFKGWSVINAYKMKSGEFEVELKKEELTQIVMFDKTGKIK